ncbi:uncharacterized protein BDV17DRAFT_256763 [Aspergillus undulatus]|uniref:uncharacterized protein n=1 Tax=Aspergillus undulatus TaxID=1810928 RepID=UPI003CCDE703
MAIKATPSSGGCDSKPPLQTPTFTSHTHRRLAPPRQAPIFARILGSPGVAPRFRPFRKPGTAT